MMLEELLRHLKNWFDAGRYFGDFTITGGSVDLPFMREGQYFRIIGSVFNDGVHQYPPKGLTDEEFKGAVWALALPEALIALAGEIESWNVSAAGKASPFVSESFDGYSYTKATNSKTGLAATWQDVFRGRLNQWRKL